MSRQRHRSSAGSGSGVMRIAPRGTGRRRRRRRAPRHADRRAGRRPAGAAGLVRSWQNLAHCSLSPIRNWRRGRGECGAAPAFRQGGVPVAAGESAGSDSRRLPAARRRAAERGAVGEQGVRDRRQVAGKGRDFRLASNVSPPPVSPLIACRGWRQAVAAALHLGLARARTAASATTSMVAPASCARVAARSSIRRKMAFEPVVA